MKRKYVTINDMAQKMKIDSSGLRKWLKKNGLSEMCFNVRTEASRGQATKAVSPEDAKAIFAEREKQGWTI